MKLLSKLMPSSFDLALFGDTHEGNALATPAAEESIVQWLHDGKNRFGVHMGDEVDAVCTDDKRYERSSTSEAIPLQQCAHVVRRYKPVAKKLLAMLYGNHPFKLHRVGNLTRDIVCAQLEIPYGTLTCKLALHDKHGFLFKNFLAHAVCNRLSSTAKDFEQAQANMMAKFKMRCKEKAGDCLVMAAGHTHKLFALPPSNRMIMTDDGMSLHHHYMTAGGADETGYIEPDRRWYVNTGGFVRLYGDSEETGYAELFGMDPIELGYAVMEVRDRKLVNIRKVVWGI